MSLPPFLRPEVLPFASVEIIEAPAESSSAERLVPAPVVVATPPGRVVPSVSGDSGQLKHYCQWDYIRPGKTSFALCGALVNPQDISNEPTCPSCQQDLALTAEDVFGPEPSRAEKLAAVKPVAIRLVDTPRKREGAA